MLTELRVELPGNRHASVYRAGDGPSLVWCHSLYGVEADAPLIDRLSERNTVYAPLAPGFTDLAELDELRDIHDLALHYDDILTALRLTTTGLAGHSFGAMIAAELAAHYPSKVSQLILASPLGLWNDDYPIPDLFGLPQPEVPSLLYRTPPPPPTTAQDLETTLALVRGMTTVARFLWPIPDRGLSRRLRRITAATLIIHGQADRFVPVQYADDFVQHIPNARKRVIPNVGHMLTVEAQDEITDAIAEFTANPERERERSIA
jgi:pimeloyl-ACP methyl ester carboxylesterase